MMEDTETISNNSNAETSVPSENSVDAEPDTQSSETIKFIKSDEVKSEPADSQLPSENGEVNSDGADEDGWVDVLGTGSLKLRTITKAESDEERPERGDFCVISYEGRLVKTDEVVEEETAKEIHLGDFEVIQGIDIVLSLMGRKQVVEIIVSPRFAFGQYGLPDKVPADSEMHYKVELLDFKTEALINRLDMKDRYEYGMRKKTRGNWWYERGDHSSAVHCYRRALEYFDLSDSPITDESLADKIKNETIKTYNNLGASQLKIKAYDAALLSLNNVLLEDPQNVKALYRKATILRQMTDIAESIDCIKEALKIDPNSKMFKTFLRETVAILKKQEKGQKEVYERMLGNPNKDSKKNKNKKDTEQSGDRATSKWKWMALGVTAAVLSVVALRYKL